LPFCSRPRPSTAPESACACLARRFDSPNGHPLFEEYSYLADTFVYDAPSNSWRVVYTEEWPEHRAGCAMVYVPAEGEGEGEGQGEPVAGGGVTAGSKVMRGRMLLLGGFIGGEVGKAMPFDRLWELKLSSGIKGLKVTCHGCGKAGTGMKLCAGSCGGAVALCGKECQAAVWQGGHKHWCKRVA
jgi:hypothetical protein